MYTYYFEKLEVWLLSKELVKQIYQLVSTYPENEKFNFISQMKRSALSVTSNIAEGYARSTSRDQANFTTISYSSLMELLNLVIISFELGFIESDSYKNIRTKIEEIGNKLNSLRNSQLKR